MRASEAVSHSNISATTAAFDLRGGNYSWALIGTLGSVTLQTLGPDGSTWMAAANAVTTSPTFTVLLYLPAGSYRLALSSASAVYSCISRVPGE